MNKCAKCGTEFEGNFCPECGTPSQAPKKCPKCGAELKENIKFCNNCGYDFFEGRHVETRKPAVKHDFDWRSLLQYLPVVFFGLWAALLWAFYASNIIQGDGFLVESLNLYGFLSDESLTQVYPLIYIFVAFAAAADLYLFILIFVYVRGYSKKAANKVCYLLYAAVLIFDIVFAVKFIKQLKEEGFENIVGNFASVNISLTVVFAFLQGVTLFLANKYPTPKGQTQGSIFLRNKAKFTFFKNDTVRNVLKYAPVVLFALWAALLWAFYASIVKQGDGIMTENENLYRVIASLNEMKNQEEIWEFIKVKYEPLLIVSYIMIGVAVVSCLQAIIYFFVTKAGGGKKLFVFTDALLYIATIICTVIFSVKAKDYVNLTHDEPGNFVAVVISLTVVFAFLQGVAIFLTNKYSVSTKEKIVTVNAKQRKNSCVKRFILHIVLKYMPLVLFVLWSVLLWAFYAVPIIKGDRFILENINLYGLLKDKTMSDLYPIAYTLIAFAAISNIYIAIIIRYYINNNKIMYQKATLYAIIFHFAVIISTIIFAIQFNGNRVDLGTLNGSFVSVVIVLTAVFGMLQTTTVVLSSFWDFNEEEFADISNNIRDSIKNWFIFMR